MEDHAASPEQRVPLPKDDGALSGIEGPFAPDLFSATGNLTSW